MGDSSKEKRGLTLRLGLTVCFCLLSYFLLEQSSLDQKIVIDPHLEFAYKYELIQKPAS